jgi:hypothetical protein
MHIFRLDATADLVQQLATFPYPSANLHAVVNAHLVVISFDRMLAAVGPASLS